MNAAQVSLYRQTIAGDLWDCFSNTYRLQDGVETSHRDMHGSTIGYVVTDRCDLMFDSVQVSQVEYMKRLIITIDFGCRNNNYLYDELSTMLNQARRIVTRTLRQIFPNGYVFEQPVVTYDQTATMNGVWPASVTLRANLAKESARGSLNKLINKPVKIGEPFVVHNPGEEPQEQWTKQACGRCVKGDDAFGKGCNECRFFGYVLVPQVVALRSTTKRKKKRSIQL